MRIFHLRLKLYGSTTWEEGEIRSWFCFAKDWDQSNGARDVATNKDKAKTLTFRNRTTAMLVSDSDSCYHGGRREEQVSILLLSWTLTFWPKQRNCPLRADMQRCQHLTLTWVYPFIVDASEEYGSRSCLQTAVYSSKRDTVDALISILVWRHMCGIAAGFKI